MQQDNKVQGLNPTQCQLYRLLSVHGREIKSPATGQWPQGWESASLRRRDRALKVAENQGIAVLLHKSYARCHSEAQLSVQIAEWHGT